jgi:uncharacterized membrane protein YkvI
VKSFSLAMLLVGTIIGAGFASGREILTFFSSDIPLFVAPIVGILIFFVSVIFLFIGKTLQKDTISEINSKLLGKSHYVADIILLFNSLIVLAGMLSGMDSLFSIIFDFAPAYSIISGIICAFVVHKGLKGLLKGNAIIVPVIILSIIIICTSTIFSTQTLSFGSIHFRLFPAIIVYVSMNMMLSSTVLTTIGSISKKQIVLSSFIAASIITLLMLLIIMALNTTKVDTAMPILSIALSQNLVLFYLSLAAIATSIFTTMMTAMSSLSSWLNSLVGDKRFSIILVLIAGLIVSNFGFENVVAFLYPLIGIAGILYISFSIVFVVKKRKNKQEKKSALLPSGN